MPFFDPEKARNAPIDLSPYLVPGNEAEVIVVRALAPTNVDPKGTWRTRSAANLTLYRQIGASVAASGQWRNPMSLERALRQIDEGYTDSLLVADAASGAHVQLTPNIFEAGTATVRPLDKVPEEPYHNVFHSMWPDFLDAHHLSSVSVARGRMLLPSDATRQAARGLGKRLFAWQSQEASKRGIELIILDASRGIAHPDNLSTDLEKYYELIGFQPIARTRSYTEGEQNPPELDVVLFSRLSAPWKYTKTGIMRADPELESAILNNDSWVTECLGQSLPLNGGASPYADQNPSSSSFLGPRTHMSAPALGQIAYATLALVMAPELRDAQLVHRVFHPATQRRAETEQDLENTLVGWLLNMSDGPTRVHDELANQPTLGPLVAAVLESRGLLDPERVLRSTQGFRQLSFSDITSDLSRVGSLSYTRAANEVPNMLHRALGQAYGGSLPGRLAPRGPQTIDSTTPKTISKLSDPAARQLFVYLTEHPEGLELRPDQIGVDSEGLLFLKRSDVLLEHRSIFQTSPNSDPMWTHTGLRVVPERKVVLKVDGDGFVLASIHREK